jgi:hypothetical protein
MKVKRGTTYLRNRKMDQKIWAFHELSAIIIRRGTASVNILHVNELSLLFSSRIIALAVAPNKDITLRPCSPEHLTALLISKILTDLEII